MEDLMILEKCLWSAFDKWYTVQIREQVHTFHSFYEEEVFFPKLRWSTIIICHK